MKRHQQIGFTLIELLVVIAIIGILSAVVLASLNSAREHARDTAIKQQVKAIATTLEADRISTGSYSHHSVGWFGNTGGNPNCSQQTFTGPSATKLRELCQGIEDNIAFDSDAFMHWGVADWYFSNSTNYSIMVKLNSEGWFCAGSSGNVYTGTAHPEGGPLYPGYLHWGGTGCYSNP